MDRILIVDDDRSIRELLSMHLEERGFGVMSASTGAEGFRLASESTPSAIVLDMRLPDASGIDLIPELKKRAAEAPVLMITAHHDMATTILAMKAGAFDYIHKPIDIQAFDVALDRALEVRRLSRGTDYLSVEGGRSFDMDDIVGTSPPMQQLFKDVGRVANSRATVLIQGESGTGKELIARVIHSYSAPQKPFIGINCSAIVDTLLESELFGHEKGAFTGAVQAKPGKFELAEDGSIFLDEIGELSQNLQAKLLRVLQEREVERVGGVRRIAIRARILAATNRDLGGEVRAGRFREDLYQRLKVVTLRLPSLRERLEDVPLLVEHLLVKINQRLHKNLRRVPREVIEKLQRRPWPGNVRELENVLTRAAVLSQGDMLLEEHLVDPGITARQDGPVLPPAVNDRIATLDEVERDHIVRVWALTKGHKGKTCQMLGISRPTLERKLKKYAIAGGVD
ncbi:MAG: sigma-54-dependent Fis family transcriptional regulator [Deltaproteobacteria bacterium]|nr:MAG: sigma-54-dependent Fis family transcriptional regulator [Deltaproteobacteria bacterium]TMA76857.1 MAG: sigma-54-dependent Fis family transcriptional regulator [Deltaproteobacteria bacterium]TMB36699.1 MAG: sigma-54-dependent Fis family transcriptional regulator [Deltaproteobacteria bacterium]